MKKINCPDCGIVLFKDIEDRAYCFECKTEFHLKCEILEKTNEIEKKSQTKAEIYMEKHCIGDCGRCPYFKIIRKKMKVVE